MGAMFPDVAASAEYTVRDQARMEQARRYFQWQFALAGKHLGACVVEVGCGLGNFTQHLAGRRLVVAVDVEPRCVERHRKRFAAHANVITLAMDVLSPEFPKLREYRPDAVACLNVLEHLPDDGQALRQIHDVLEPGGKAVLIVPAFQALYGPIDERLGHYRRYSKQQLLAAARQAGFAPRILSYLNSAGFFGWWLNAHIWKRTEQSAFQIRIFDALAVPVLRCVESCVEPPFGQSIFAVLERR
jgi:SAM-dependent methyltransferase